jgi:hypothetical protein
VSRVEIAHPLAELRHRLDSTIITTELANEAGVPSAPNVLGRATTCDELSALADSADLGDDLVVPPSSTLKRLAVAAAVSGAAIAATPALANAASTCTYPPDALLPRVDVFDASGSQSLRIHRKDQFIAITDGGGTKLCAGPAGSLATRFNTD